VKLALEWIRLPLAHFDLDVDATVSARVTGIFGPSGAGKTSLLDVIAGLRKPADGHVRIDDALLDDVPARRRHIGYVPQENALFPHLTVEQNIRYGARNADIAPTVSVLEIVHILPRRVTSLSGGEQKRVALARALVTAPRLLLLDEPLAGVDHPLRDRITAYLQRVRDELAIPMLYVTHDPAELAEIAEETLVMEQGKIKKRMLNVEC
jgi:molybdate transport system ATP-binding protein